MLLYGTVLIFGGKYTRYIPIRYGIGPFEKAFFKSIAANKNEYIKSDEKSLCIGTLAHSHIFIKGHSAR
jgi:hypothetical protein